MLHISEPATYQPANLINDDLKRSIEFLHSIGIECIFTSLDDYCFLPGLSINEGRIEIDLEKLSNPGDILHEAGHIAVVSANERKLLTAASICERENRDAEEMMAIAWSYAACVYLQINPQFVFHNDGYKGGGQSIADNFMNGRYFGLPMLQWVGMTADEKNAGGLGIEPFPVMIKWLRD